MIIGQLLAPVHGSNVMTAILLESLQNLGYKIEIVQKTFSRTMNEVEKISFRKVLKVFLISGINSSEVLEVGGLIFVFILTLSK